jgi:4'-phosphopantetheinyl transferase
MLSPARISVLFAGDEALPSEQESAWLADLSDARRARIEAMPDPSDRRRSLIASRLLMRGPSAGHFSSSHCPGRVVCAMSRITPVGVDVEPLDASPPGRTSLYLNPGERAAAGGDPHRLLWLWTRKEAVAKAAGRRGLRMLGQIDVRADLVDCEGKRWHLLPLDLGPGFVAHLACAAPAPPVAIRAHSAESLR